MGEMDWCVGEILNRKPPVKIFPSSNSMNGEMDGLPKFLGVDHRENPRENLRKHGEFTIGNREMGGVDEGKSKKKNTRNGGVDMGKSYYKWSI